MFDDDFDEDDIDYIGCPSCGSNVAVVEPSYIYNVQYAHCKHDCGYKWTQLIEPDPETFHNEHPYKHILDKNGKPFYSELGHESEIVPFDGSMEYLEELYYEDRDRYNRILKYSDFNKTLLLHGSLSLDPDVPNNLEKKRERFFNKQATILAKTQDGWAANTLHDFITDTGGEYTFTNVIYVLCMMGHMESHKNKHDIVETEEYNSNLENLHDNGENIFGTGTLEKEVKYSAITYTEYNKVEISKFFFILSEEYPNYYSTLDDFIEKIHNKMNIGYGIPLLYVKPENDKNDGCRPLESWQRDTVEKNGGIKNLEELTKLRINELKEGFQSNIFKEYELKLKELQSLYKINGESLMSDFYESINEFHNDETIKEKLLMLEKDIENKKLSNEGNKKDIVELDKIKEDILSHGIRYTHTLAEPPEFPYCQPIKNETSGVEPYIVDSLMKIGKTNINKEFYEKQFNEIREHHKRLEKLGNDFINQEQSINLYSKNDVTDLVNSNGIKSLYYSKQLKEKTETEPIFNKGISDIDMLEELKKKDVLYVVLPEIKKEDKDIELFFNKKTTYGKTIKELFEIIKDCEPIASINALKPFIITLEEFYSDIKNNMDIPSLIDYDNNIVFMNISHKSIINTLNLLNLDVYSENTHNCPDDYTAKQYFRLSKPTTEADYNDFINDEYQGDVEFFKECLEEDSELNNFIIMKNKNNLEYLTHIEKYDGFDRNWNIEEIQKWLDNGNSKRMISYHEYEEYSNLTGEELELFFHKETNTVQVFTSLVDSESPKMLTFRIENKENKELMDLLDKEKIKYDTLTSLSNKDFITLNGTGVISGEIYFPKTDEENIPSGKILVIPTASEDYFLPALSAMDGNGCIITEKGSKTSHLVINSKEFKFNLILVDNATNLFKDGDIVNIDLDNNFFN